MKITAESVADAMRSAPPNKTKYYFDDDLAGFGFYRTATGTGTFFVEFRPVAGGTKKRLKLGRVGTLKSGDAREAARKAIAHAGLGRDLAGDRAEERAGATVKDLVAEYIAGREMKPSTRSFYEIALHKHIGPELGNSKAVTLTRVDVQRAHMRIGRGAKYMANRAVALLAAAYVWGGKRGLVPEGTNPAAKIDKNKEAARERYLSPDELLRLGVALQEAETTGIPHRPSNSKHAPKTKNRTVFGPHVTGAIRLLMLTGCRLREILKLRWTEYDATRGLLLLPDSKTGRKTVVLSSAAQAVLNSLPRTGVFAIAGQSAGTPDEKPRADLKKPWAAISERAGLVDVRLHDLRHTFASVGAGGGMSLQMIGKLLGHADTATTQRYAHLHVDPVRAAADSIAGQIAAALGPK